MCTHAQKKIKLPMWLSACKISWALQLLQVITSTKYCVVSCSKRKKSQLLPLALYAPALCNNLEQCSETFTRSQQLLWHQFSVFTVESSTVQLFLMQHQMNALRIDVGYHQHSNYLINRRSKNKDCRVMDPPTTGIKKGWLCWESHLCTKERSAVYSQ